MRWIVASILATMQECEDHWLVLASDIFGLLEHALQVNAADRDSMLLSILIHIIHPSICSSSWMPWVLLSHTQFNICDMLPDLQHIFCVLWNEKVLYARENGDGTYLHIKILCKICHSYMALHQDMDAAPTAFSSSTNDDTNILSDLWSYLLCTIKSHQSDSAVDTHLTTLPAVPPPTMLGYSSGALLQVVFLSCRT
jgi:hypothetical protein